MRYNITPALRTAIFVGWFNRYDRLSSVFPPQIGSRLAHSQPKKLEGYQAYESTKAYTVGQCARAVCPVSRGDVL